MSTQLNASVNQKNTINHKNTVVAGVVLLAIGLMALGGQFIRGELLGMIFLPALSAIFIVAGLVTRNAGTIIPGGILGGIGLGAYLVQVPFAGVGEQAQGGVFLLAFAAGWAAITVLTLLIGKGVHLWPLVPAAVLALVGSALLMGGTALTVLTWVGRGWPIVLIGLGLYMILFRRGLKQ